MRPPAPTGLLTRCLGVRPDQASPLFGGSCSRCGAAGLRPRDAEPPRMPGSRGATVPWAATTWKLCIPWKLCMLRACFISTGRKVSTLTAARPRTGGAAIRCLPPDGGCGPPGESSKGILTALPRCTAGGERGALVTRERCSGSACPARRQVVSPPKSGSRGLIRPPAAGAARRQGAPAPRPAAGHVDAAPHANSGADAANAGADAADGEPAERRVPAICPQDRP
jgi:hypothetical protein